MHTQRIQVPDSQSNDSTKVEFYSFGYKSLEGVQKFG